MAGTPEQRAEDLMRFFKDPEIKPLLPRAAATAHQYVLPLLDYDVIRKNPKPLIGFSDITALQAGIYAQTGNISYAGILLKYDFAGGNIHPYTAQNLLQTLDGTVDEIAGGVTVNPRICRRQTDRAPTCAFCSFWPEQLLSRTSIIRFCCWKTSTTKAIVLNGCCCNCASSPVLPACRQSFSDNPATFISIIRRQGPQPDH